jgi:hypothetical protein
MAGTLNSKTPTAPAGAPAASAPDRTSAIVTTTLIFLTGLGILTVFWEPLAALALGTPAAEAPSAEPHATAVVDGGAPTATSTDGSGNS